jgi:hypothetical protein
MRYLFEENTMSLLSRWLSCVLAVATLLAPKAHADGVAQAISRSERALYAADFATAHAVLQTPLGNDTDLRAKAELLLQKVRIQQVARLSGLPDPREAATLSALSRIANSDAASRDLKARIDFAGTVSEYFRRITGPALGELRPLQARFEAAAGAIADPCRRADALFFAALMPQIEDKVPESAAGLRQARQLAEANHCLLELSYDLRHLAVVAEAQGDLSHARELAAESLALRRRIGFQVYVPYSLLTLADFDEKLGKTSDAERERHEALAISERLRLPAQAEEARKALAPKQNATE